MNDPIDGHEDLIKLDELESPVRKKKPTVRFVTEISQSSESEVAYYNLFLF
jgi:hypothetical protein